MLNKANSQTHLPFPYNKISDLSINQVHQIAAIHTSETAALDSAFQKNRTMIIDEENRRKMPSLIDNDTINLRHSLITFYTSRERMLVDPLLTPEQKQAVIHLIQIHPNKLSLANFEKYRRKQNGNALCWAACVQMLLNYYGVQATQQQIIQLVLGSVDNETENMDDLNKKINGFHPAFDDPNHNSWIVNINPMPIIPDDMLVGMMTPFPYYQGKTVEMMVASNIRLTLIGIENSHLCVVNKIIYKGVAPSRVPVSITYYDPLLDREVDVQWNDTQKIITNWYYCFAVNEKQMFPGKKP